MKNFEAENAQIPTDMDKLRNEVTLVGMPIGNRNDNGFKKLSDLIEKFGSYHKH